MKIRGLLISAAVALTMAPPAMAERASDGNVSIIYWQAPSILCPPSHSFSFLLPSFRHLHQKLGLVVESGDIFVLVVIDQYCEVMRLCWSPSTSVTSP